MLNKHFFFAARARYCSNLINCHLRSNINLTNSGDKVIRLRISNGFRYSSM